MENLLEEDRKKKELSKSQESSTPEYAIGLTTPVEVLLVCRFEFFYCLTICLKIVPNFTRKYGEIVKHLTFS